MAISPKLADLRDLQISMKKGHTMKLAKDLKTLIKLYRFMKSLSNCNLKLTCFITTSKETILQAISSVEGCKLTK